MSATGDRDPTQAGQEGPVSPAGAWAGADDGAAGRSGPYYGVVAPVVEAAGVARPVGGLGEEAGGPAAALAGAPEGGSTEEDSDIGPAVAEEEEEAEEENVSPGGPDRMVDARQFPMAGFRFMFLDLVHFFLHRLYYNDHILIRAPGVRLLVTHRRPTPSGDGAEGGEGASDVPMVLQAPERPGARAAAREGEGEGEGRGPDLLPAGASGREPEQPAGGAAQEAEEEEEEEMIVTAHEVTKYQYENWDDEDTQEYIGGGAKEAEEEKEKEDEGPQTDMDPGEGEPGKSSWEE